MEKELMAVDITSYTPSDTAPTADFAAFAAAAARAAARPAAVLVTAMEDMRAITARLALLLTSAADLKSVIRSRS